MTDGTPRLHAAATGALGAGLVLTTAITTLLYSQLFADNVMAKGGVLLVGAGVLLGALALLAVSGARLVLPRLPLYLPWLCLCGWSLLAALAAVNKPLAMESLLVAASPFVVFLGTVASGGRPGAARRLVAVVVVVNVAVSAIGLLQFAGIPVLPLTPDTRTLPVSTLGNPNFAAYYQVLILPLLVSLLWSRSRQWPVLLRLGVGGALLLSAAHLVVTGSRAGWLSAAFSLLVLARLLRSRQLWSRSTVGVVLAVLLLYPVAEAFLQSVPLGSDESLFSPAARLGRRTWDRALTVFDSSDFSSGMRVLIWRDTLKLIGAAPLLGVGPGHYWQSLPPHMDRQRWTELVAKRTHLPHEPRHAENEYLEAAAETGLVGLAIFLWLHGALVWLALRYLRQSSGADSGGGAWQARGVTAGILCGTLGALMHAFAGFNLHHPAIVLHLWLLAGIMVSLQPERPREAGPDVAVIGLGSRAARVAAGAVGAVLALAWMASGVRVLLGEHYFVEGESRLASGDAVGALRAYTQAVAWREHDFQSYRQLGRLAMASGLDLQARGALERSLQLHPNDAGALRLLGGLLIRQRDPGAVPVLQRAVAVDRANSQGQLLLAQAYRHAGMLDSAVAVLQRGLTSAPREPRLMTALALAYRDQGKLDDCLAVLEEGVQAWPEDGRLAGNLGALYVELGRGPQAEVQLRRALRYHEEGRTEWLANLSQALALQGRVEEARQTLEEAMRRSPDDSRLRALATRLGFAPGE